MSPLLKKEIRLLLPAWGVALLLAAVPPWFMQHPSHAADTYWVGVIGAVILAVTIIGREFAMGTASFMLAQPVPRGQIIATKGMLLLLALVTVLVAYWVSYVVRVETLIEDPGRYWYTRIPIEEQKEQIRQQRWGVLGFGSVGIAVIFAGGLWTTLLFRQMVASFWVTVLAPGLLMAMTTWVALLFGSEETSLIVCTVLLVYAIAGVAWAWRLFPNLEDTSFSLGGRDLPSVGELVGARRPWTASGPGRWIATLVRQELSIHQAGLVAAVALLLLNLGCIGIRASGLLDERSDVHDVLEPIGFLWLLIPLVIGASTIAEERRLGTLEPYLCLPVSRRMKSLIKFGIAGGLGVLFGAGALAATELLGRQLGVVGILAEKEINAATVFWLTIASLGLTLAGAYASSLTSSTLQALGLGLVLWIGAFFITLWVVDHLFYFRVVESEWGPRSWILWVNLGAFLCGIAFLTYRNAGELRCGARQVIRNCLSVVLTLAVVGSLSAGTYFRIWEFLMPLEPDHGPARISGEGRTKMVGRWLGSLTILLPDGRLWISAGGEKMTLGQSYAVHAAPGAFSTVSNCVDVAATFFQTVALRSDGTLWSLDRSEKEDKKWLLVENSPRLLEGTTNWAAIASGVDHFIALKTDGTLWGWGYTTEGQLGFRQADIVSEPVRVGDEDDWTGVFAKSRSCVATKPDGSTWRWGRIRVWDPDKGKWSSESVIEPVPWNVDLSGIKRFWGRGRIPIDLALRDDASLWVLAGHLNYVLGTRLDLRPGPDEEPVQAGGGHAWADVAATWPMVGVRLDGSLWLEPWERRSRARLRRPSRHSDWLAVVEYGTCAHALSADGTVSCWIMPGFQLGPALSPTRRAIASFNIFDEVE